MADGDREQRHDAVAARSLDWITSYSRGQPSSDLMAAVIVTIMLVPQSLAYAMLAGLPPAGRALCVDRAAVCLRLFGTSRTLAVGPVAVVSLMTAAAIGKIAEAGKRNLHRGAAMVLALMSGVASAGDGDAEARLPRQFSQPPRHLRHSSRASGILIAASQLKHILGIRFEGDNLAQMATALWPACGRDQPWPPLSIGLAAIAFLFWVRSG